MKKLWKRVVNGKSNENGKGKEKDKRKSKEKEIKPGETEFDWGNLNLIPYAKEQ